MKMWTHLLLAVSVALTACAPASPRSAGGQEAANNGSQPAVRKRLVLGVLDTPPTLISRFERLLPAAPDIEAAVTVGLALKDDKYSWAPVLAEEVPSIENGLWKVFPDGRMETIWHLRPNLTWHDGSPFSSDDILFTWAVGSDPETQFFQHSGYKRIDSVVAPDARTILVRWKEPFIDAASVFSNYTQLSVTFPLPRHLLEPAYQTNKSGLWESSFWSDDFIGTGPYRLREWARGRHAILEAFDGYVLGRPRIDEIEIRFFADQNALIPAVASGAVQATIGQGIALEAAVDTARRWPDVKLDHLGFDSWQAVYPQFINPNPQVIANLQFRRALMHATDRQELVDSLAFGMAPVAHSYMNQANPAYPLIEPLVMKYDYDPQRAEEMITALGYVRGADRFFRDPSGQTLQLEIRTSGGGASNRIIESVADYWRRAGVGVDTLAIPAQRLRDLEWRATRPGFELTRRGTIMERVDAFHSRDIQRPETRWIGSNIPRYADPDFDALIERYFVTIPQNERTDVAGRIVQHISERLPIMGLLYEGQPALISNRLVNARGGSSEVIGTRNIYQWDLH